MQSRVKAAITLATHSLAWVDMSAFEHALIGTNVRPERVGGEGWGGGKWQDAYMMKGVAHMLPETL